MKTKRRIFFSEFKNAIAERDLRLVALGDYIEMDPDSPVPKVQFRADALLDDAPEDFDVDRFVYQYLQALDEERYEAEAFVAPFGLRKVVGEGDSWMNLPGPLGWKAIGDSIHARKNFRIRNIGYWGDTLKEILADKQYMDKIESYAPDYFILSAGGNDMQDVLAAGGLIKEYDPKLDPIDYLTSDGEDVLTEIGENYATLLTEVTNTFSGLKVFTHSYDYPRPLLGKGKFLGQHLRKRGIKDELMSPILNHVLSRLDTTIKQATNAFPSVIHVQNFGVTEDYLWRDDFHPKNPGFDMVTQAIEVAISRS